MVWSKRARPAETPKQPSLDLPLRAPYFYPDWCEGDLGCEAYTGGLQAV